MKVHDSALKHGVLPEDAVQAADWPLWIEPVNEEENWPEQCVALRGEVLLIGGASGVPDK